ncbi:MAG: helix-turn-helix domain-containing protein [Pseudomonadota bacterium]
MITPQDAVETLLCPVGHFVGLISGKWAIPVLYRLIAVDAPIRFNALQRALAPVTQKELTRQLRHLAQRGLVAREVHAEVPPRVEYRITPLGRTLWPALASLADWVRTHEGDLQRHESGAKDTSGGISGDTSEDTPLTPFY